MLSKRQKETLELAITGMPVKEAAFRLGVSVNTAKMHLHESYKKLKVRSLCELMSRLVDEKKVKELFDEN